MVKNNRRMLVIIGFIAMIIILNQGKKEGGTDWGYTLSECNSYRQDYINSGDLCVTNCYEMTPAIHNCIENHEYTGYDSSDEGKYYFYWDTNQDCTDYFDELVNVEHDTKYTAIALCVPAVGNWLSSSLAPIDIYSFSTNKDGQIIYPGDEITAIFTASNLNRPDKSDFIAEFSMYPKYQADAWGYIANGQKYGKKMVDAGICCPLNTFTGTKIINVPYGQTNTFTITTKIPDRLDIFNCGDLAYNTVWDSNRQFLPLIEIFENCAGTGDVNQQDWDSNPYMTVTCRTEIAGNNIDDDCDGTRDEGSCTPNWQCTSWSTCSSSCTQTRTCTDSNNCDVTTGKPIELQLCTGGLCSIIKSFEITSFSIDKLSVKESEVVTATITIKNNEVSCPLGLDDNSINNKCNWAVEFGLYPKRLSDSWGFQPNSKKTTTFTVTSCAPDVWTSSTGLKLNPGASQTFTMTATTSNRNSFTQNAPVLYAFDIEIVPIAIIYKTCGDPSSYSDWKTLNTLPLTCTNPGTEISNGKDDDCDGEIDEGVEPTPPKPETDWTTILWGFGIFIGVMIAIKMLSKTGK